MEFVVKRSMWARGPVGDDEGYRRLLSSVGTRCCLGFVAAQCGVGDSELLDNAEPSDIFCTAHTQDLRSVLLGEKEDDDGIMWPNSDLSKWAIGINGCCGAPVKNLTAATSCAA